jgi:diacylglycerol kinase
MVERASQPTAQAAPVDSRKQRQTINQNIRCSASWTLDAAGAAGAAEPKYRITTGLVVRAVRMKAVLRRTAESIVTMMMRVMRVGE